MPPGRFQAGCSGRRAARGEPDGSTKRRGTRKLEPPETGQVGAVRSAPATRVLPRICAPTVAFRGSGVRAWRPGGAAGYGNAAADRLGDPRRLRPRKIEDLLPGGLWLDPGLRQRGGRLPSVERLRFRPVAEGLARGRCPGAGPACRRRHGFGAQGGRGTGCPGGDGGARRCRHARPTRCPRAGFAAMSLSRTAKS